MTTSSAEAIEPRPAAAARSGPAHGGAFRDRLAIALDLRIGSGAFSVAAGSIARLAIQATTYGFEAEVAFTIASELETDALFPRFCSNDLIAATLSVANGNEGFADEEAPPLKLAGFVTERRLEETAADDLEGGPIVGRRYTARIVDPAQAFWRQHRPIELHAGASMRQVLEQHVCPGMRLAFDWPRLDEAADVLCVGLGGESEASFYDLVAWYLHANHGVIELDAAEGRYRLAASKSRAHGEASLDADLVGEVRLVIPEPPRRAAAVLNAFADAAIRRKSVANDHALAGVELGALVRTATPARADRRAALEASRLAPGEPLVDIALRRCPPALSPPGSAIALGQEFSERLYPAGKKYRVIALDLDARGAEDGGEPDLDDGSAPFAVTMRLRAERESDPVPRLPAFRRPSYPVLVEGRVLSASGAEDERTWHALEGESDSLHRVRIEIPLWNRTIVAPFDPGRVPGHWFMPPYKGQRVLVALDVEAAQIRSYLDGAGRLPQDTQGDQIVLGKRAGDQTTVRHVYEDNRPVLRVERRLAGDLQTLVLSEGTIRLEVREDPATPSASPTYDLRPTVDAAKERVAAEARGAVAGVTGQLEAATGGVSRSLEGAGAEVEAALAQAAAILDGKMASVEAELRGTLSGAAEALQAVVAGVSEAKAAILGALVG
ncbi:hypothetical protein [Sorangium sp. So ce861]|uniref:hypothetical protein n=1 Tax=Sorangium sp. So ce861 TaxID=3133323 RepID=UPI003F5F6491